MKYEEIVLHMFILISYLMTSPGFAATPRLRQDEVGALKEIGKKLGIEKTVWNFDLDPCSGEGNWSLPETRKGFETSLSCDCSFDSNTTCRVFRM